MRDSLGGYVHSMRFLFWILALGAAAPALGVLLKAERLGAAGAIVLAIALIGIASSAQWRAKVAESRIVLWLEQLIPGSRNRRTGG
jgi:hypothetical protein